MSKGEENSKRYDLEERKFQFAKAVRAFLKMLPRTMAHEEDIRQLVKASGSVGANYIEANESLSKKDFILRINPDPKMRFLARGAERLPGLLENGFHRRTGPGLHRTQGCVQDVGAAPRVPPARSPGSRRGAAELSPLRLQAVMALFSHQVNISRNEAKENRYWFRLHVVGEKGSLGKIRGLLIQEATELMNIFGSIARKSE